MLGCRVPEAGAKPWHLGTNSMQWTVVSSGSVLFVPAFVACPKVSVFGTSSGSIANCRPFI